MNKLVKCETLFTPCRAFTCVHTVTKQKWNSSSTSSSLREMFLQRLAPTFNYPVADALGFSVRWECETQNAALAAGLGGGSYT